jgi:hypothetical protein
MIQAPGYNTFLLFTLPIYKLDSLALSNISVFFQHGLAVDHSASNPEIVGSNLAFRSVPVEICRKKNIKRGAYL